MCFSTFQPYNVCINKFSSLFTYKTKIKIQNSDHFFFSNVLFSLSSLSLLSLSSFSISHSPILFLRFRKVEVGEERSDAVTSTCNRWRWRRSMRCHGDVEGRRVCRWWRCEWDSVFFLPEFFRGGGVSGVVQKRSGWDGVRWRKGWRSGEFSWWWWKRRGSETRTV